MPAFARSSGVPPLPPTLSPRRCPTVHPLAGSAYRWRSSSRRRTKSSCASLSGSGRRWRKSSSPRPADMSQVPTAHLAAWNGLAPGTNPPGNSARLGSGTATNGSLRGCRLGRAIHNKISGRQARPAHSAAWHGARPDRGRAFNPGCGLPDAHMRRALQRRCSPRS